MEGSLSFACSLLGLPAAVLRNTGSRQISAALPPEVPRLQPLGPLMKFPKIEERQTFVFHSRSLEEGLVSFLSHDYLEKPLL